MDDAEPLPFITSRHRQLLSRDTIIRGFGPYYYYSFPYPSTNKSKNTFRFVSCGGIEPPTPSITPEHKTLGVTIQLFTHPISNCVESYKIFAISKPMTICMENARTRCFGFAYRMSIFNIASSRTSSSPCQGKTSVRLSC